MTTKFEQVLLGLGLASLVLKLTNAYVEAMQIDEIGSTVLALLVLVMLIVAIGLKDKSENLSATNHITGGIAAFMVGLLVVNTITNGGTVETTGIMEYLWLIVLWSVCMNHTYNLPSKQHKLLTNLGLFTLGAVVSGTVFTVFWFINAINFGNNIVVYIVLVLILFGVTLLPKADTILKGIALQDKFVYYGWLYTVYFLASWTAGCPLVSTLLPIDAWGTFAIGFFFLYAALQSLTAPEPEQSNT